MHRKNIAIIFGGYSPEYNVSLESAGCVVTHLNKEKYTPVLIGITRSGDWYHFTGDADRIADDTWYSADSCAPAMLSPDRSRHELLTFHSSGFKKTHIDTVFQIMHGKNGEDGTLQGLCELAGLPLVGCGTLASALAMDKDRAHKLAQAAGVIVPQSFVLTRKFNESYALAQAGSLGYPLFVKPVKAGSSYGITKVTERGGLLRAIALAFEYDKEVIVEAAVTGFEVGCAVMGNEELITGELDEIELELEDSFFDFTEKYNLVTSKIHVPARIPPETAARVRQTAMIIYRALGCRGFARVDMFLTPAGEIVFNEVNTIPGFTPHSRFPSMMRAAGFSFEQVITRAIELAVAE